MRDNQRELRLLSGRLIQAQETERRRIARELHDDLSQSLALLSVKIDVLRQKSATPAAIPGGSVDERRPMSSSSHRRSIISPINFTRSSSSNSGWWRQSGPFRRLSRSHGVAIDFTHGEAPAAISDDAASCLYRIVQESARNVIKHSGAQRSGRAAGQHRSHLLANCRRWSGIRSAPGSRQRWIGPGQRREHLQLVGGTLSIDSRPAGGTRIDVRIPLAAANKDATRSRADSRGPLQVDQSRVSSKS